MEYSKSAAHKRKKEINELKIKLDRANKKLAMINVSANNAVQLIQKINVKIDEIKTQLQKYSLQAAQGAILRAKAQ